MQKGSSQGGTRARSVGFSGRTSTFHRPSPRCLPTPHSQPRLQMLSEDNKRKEHERFVGGRRRGARAVAAHPHSQRHPTHRTGTTPPSGWTACSAEGENEEQCEARRDYLPEAARRRHSCAAVMRGGRPSGRDTNGTWAGTHIHWVVAAAESARQARQKNRTGSQQPVCAPLGAHSTSARSLAHAATHRGTSYDARLLQKCPKNSSFPLGWPKLGCITPYSERPSPKFYATDEGRLTSLNPTAALHRCR